MNPEPEIEIFTPHIPDPMFAYNALLLTLRLESAMLLTSDQ